MTFIAAAVVGVVSSLVLRARLTRRRALDLTHRLRATAPAGHRLFITPGRRLGF